MTTEIWDKVCETNPNTTKEVSYGRKFTAIDAYAQIHRATELFGPVGIGWGWTVEWDYSVPGVVGADIDFWFIDPKSNANRGNYHVSGGAPLKGDPNKDHDAKKKALTDAVTKALSYLGFNADVFLGKFDDNKYVEQMKQKSKETPSDGTFTAAEKTTFDELVKDGDALAFECYMRTLPVPTMTALCGSFPQGQRTKMRKEIDELSRRGQSQVLDYVTKIEKSQDDAEILELWNELTKIEKKHIWSKLAAETQDYLRQLKGDT